MIKRTVFFFILVFFSQIADLHSQNYWDLEFKGQAVREARTDTYLYTKSEGTGDLISSEITTYYADGKIDKIDFERVGNGLANIRHQYIYENENLVEIRESKGDKIVAYYLVEPADMGFLPSVVKKGNDFGILKDISKPVSISNYNYDKAGNCIYIVSQENLSPTKTGAELIKHSILHYEKKALFWEAEKIIQGGALRENELKRYRIVKKAKKVWSERLIRQGSDNYIAKRELKFYTAEEIADPSNLFKANDKIPYTVSDIIAKLEEGDLTSIDENEIELVDMAIKMIEDDLESYLFQPNEAAAKACKLKALYLIDLDQYEDAIPLLKRGLEMAPEKSELKPQLTSLLMQQYENRDGSTGIISHYESMFDLSPVEEEEIYGYQKTLKQALIELKAGNKQIAEDQSKPVWEFVSENLPLDADLSTLDVESFYAITFFGLVDQLASFMEQAGDYLNSAQYYQKMVEYNELYSGKDSLDYSHSLENYNRTKKLADNTGH